MLREPERFAPDNSDPLVRGAGLELDPLEPRWRLQHKLHRLALAFDDDRPQRLMARRYGGEARRKCGDVEPTLEERDYDDVIIVARGVEPREHVHPLLLERQRRVCFPGLAPGR